MSNAKPDFLDVDGVSIACRAITGVMPGVVWLGGYKSDMLGTKAETLATWAADNACAFLRHDYSGHGESGGDFVDGTISKWLNQSLAVFKNFTHGRQILVGSSMGAWIALRMAQELNRTDTERVAGLVLLAPAPDFTAELIEPELTDAQKQSLEQRGFFEEPSDYSDEPYIYTRTLIEDGRRNLVMTKTLTTQCPVHILQGRADDAVPVSHAVKLAELLSADKVTLTLIPDGDHRLSRPQDLDLMVDIVTSMIEQAR